MVASGLTGFCAELVKVNGPVHANVAPPAGLFRNNLIVSFSQTGELLLIDGVAGVEGTVSTIVPANGAEVQLAADVTLILV